MMIRVGLERASKVTYHLYDQKGLFISEFVCLSVRQRYDTKCGLRTRALSELNLLIDGGKRSTKSGLLPEHQRI